MKYLGFIFIVFFSLSSYAKDIDSNIDKVKCSVENYELCLKHENRGVVESTLENIIKFKYRCPDADYNSIENQLIVLSEKYDDDYISKKAALVLQILQNQDLVTEIGNNFYSSVNQYLDAILLNSRFEQELSSAASP